MANYIKIEKLGDGGFGEVWRCQRDSDGEAFALKFLLSDLPDDIRRFQREAKLLSSLNHPNVIKILDADLENVPVWFAMPQYAGSLEKLVPLRDHEAVQRIFLAILDGLEYAHGHNVIHRDLKPANILFDSAGSIAITDFGLGRQLDAATTRLTTTGDVFGTRAYMPPEQLRDCKHVDFRTDIYSLGILLRELYTGYPFPFSQAQLPASVAVIVERCTEADPNRRYQTVDDLRRMFTALTSGVRRVDADERLKQLADTMRNQGGGTPDQVNETVKLIMQCQEDLGTLHYLVVRLPQDTFARVSAENPEVARLLISKFEESCHGGDLSFAYTDVIGSTCARLSGATRDPEVRAILAATALQVGVGYNRFHVMGIAGSLIQAVQDDESAIALFKRIEPLKTSLPAINEYFDKRKLHPMIRILLETTEGN